MEKNEKKNIILITIDSLRVDQLGCYGSKNKTKNIDNFAKKGIIYTKAFSNGSNTMVSVPVFLTSKYPPKITSSTLTIAEVLQRNGYKTAVFNPNVLMLHGYCRNIKIYRGFKHVELFLSKHRKLFEPYVEFLIGHYGKILKNIILGKRLKFLTKILTLPALYVPIPIDVPCPRADIITKNAISWIETNKDKPMFIWINYMDAHEPYLPQEKFESVIEKIQLTKLNRKLRYFNFLLNNEEIIELKSLYSKSIEYIDKYIGLFLEAIKEIDLGDTTIILTSDHGEQFNEHGSFVHPQEGLYNEQLHIPLIIYDPSKNSNKIDYMVSLRNIPKTIINIAGLKSNYFDGMNLLDINNDENPIISFGNPEGDYLSVISQGYKLIIKNFGNTSYELYDLQKDANEKIDISSKFPDIKYKLLDILKKHMDKQKKTNTYYEKLIIKRKIKKLKLNNNKL